MDVQSQLLGVLPDMNRNYGGRTKEGLAQDPARTKASPFRPTARDERVYIKKTNFFNVLEHQSRLAMWPAGKG